MSEEPETEAYEPMEVAREVYARRIEGELVKGSFSDFWERIQSEYTDQTADGHRTGPVLTRATRGEFVDLIYAAVCARNAEAHAERANQLLVKGEVLFRSACERIDVRSNEASGTRSYWFDPRTGDIMADLYPDKPVSGGPSMVNERSRSVS